MKMKIIQLFKNFYIDATDRTTEYPIGDYISLGYYDGVQIRESIEYSEGKKSIIGESIRHLELPNIDSGYSGENVVCVTLDNERDDLDDTEVPFLFISFIRIKENVRYEDLIRKVSKIHEDPQNVVYTAYNHSEVVVLYRTDSYREGSQHAFKLRKEFDSMKISTVFAVRWKILADLNLIKNKIKDEVVSCNVRALVKDMSKVYEFVGEIERIVKVVEPELLSTSFHTFRTLGKEDLLLEIRNIKLSTILLLYSKGENGIMTPQSRLYRETFYSVHTDILIREVKDNNARDWED